jgi:hypothetical protein
MAKKKEPKPTARKRASKSSKGVPTKARTKANVELTDAELKKVSGGIATTAPRLGMRLPVVSAW